jgi:hypothetical protein
VGLLGGVSDRSGGDGDLLAEPVGASCWYLSGEGFLGATGAASPPPALAFLSLPLRLAEGRLLLSLLLLPRLLLAEFFDAGVDGSDSAGELLPFFFFVSAAALLLAGGVVAAEAAAFFLEPDFGGGRGSSSSLRLPDEEEDEDDDELLLSTLSDHPVLLESSSDSSDSSLVPEYSRLGDADGDLGMVVFAAPGSAARECPLNWKVQKGAPQWHSTIII